MITRQQMQELAREHGTPLFIVDHDELRRNIAMFRKYLPRVTPFYAIKSNPMPEIVHTLYEEGASFDVASQPEFEVAVQNIKHMSEAEQKEWIYNRIIYANTIKPMEMLEALDKYRLLVTYDNEEEIKKLKKYSPNSRAILRICVPNKGAVVELSSKFGAFPEECVDLVYKALDAGISVEGLSFHVGSQTTEFENYTIALNLAADIFEQVAKRGYKKMHMLDLGGGYPAPYDESVKPFPVLAEVINKSLNALFPKEVFCLAEPGRFMNATAGTSVARINGRTVRGGKTRYYINDGAYHTYSGIIFDHQHCHVHSFRENAELVECAVFGPTCDALDVISAHEQLPADLQIGDLVYSDNMGAYSHASSTWFNGFPPAKVVHINLKK
ncbi:MAG: type III PLP-dependent enzyme [Elusimicrobiales bacterium]|nr:type III PLP-dependent enzyme [Elusimicrobiales bacterium]